MSLMILKEPKILKVSNAGGLKPGSWFQNGEGQILSILIDERTDERRVAVFDCFERPIIAKRSIRQFTVKNMLKAGTLVQIVQPGLLDEGRKNEQ